MPERTGKTPGVKRYFLFAAIFIAALRPFPDSYDILQVAGWLILISFFFVVFYLFLFHFAPDVLKSGHKILFILALTCTFPALVKLAFQYPEKNLLPVIPFAMVAVLTRTFYDARLSLFVLLITLFLAGFFVPDPFEFVMINLLAGVVAIYTLSAHRKGNLFYTAAFVFLTNSLLFTGLRLLEDGDFDRISFISYASFFLNGFLVLLSYPVILIFERRFLHLSDSTLLEYADTSQPLLRKMADEAPGSFQHSLQVANLAEEAARISGANPLLVRVGALYHDIGKIAAPDYFIENQKIGASPHDTLDPGSSARLIINHVNSGVILAKNYKLPQQIIDFIITHHGTSVAYYFYKKYTMKRSRENLNIADFSYPGPKPFSKETAIIMMADAVEASSRSLEIQSEESISDLVDRIILLQEQDEQYSDVPFTYREISDIREVFKKRLMTMYHGRIAYPGIMNGDND